MSLQAGVTELNVERPNSMLIDLDDTLITSDVNRQACWDIIDDEFSRNIPNIGSITFVARKKLQEFWSDPVRHKRWRFDLRGARAVVLKQTFNDFAIFDSNLAERISDRFSELRDSRTSLFPGTHETLHTLREMGIRLALLTNGNAYLQRKKVKQFDLEDKFDFIFIEGEQGYGKPENRAYLDTLEKLGSKCSEAWIAGDKFEWEVVAPQSLGIKAVWINSRDEKPPDDGVQPFLTLNSFPEIIRYIG